MRRNRIFISYSRRDQQFLQEFQVHLKPWQDKGLLNIWRDRDIPPGEDWQEAIQQALEATAVVVLLVSPDFLASDYIRTQELPYVVRARAEGEIELVCLYLRHSNVDSDDMAIAVELSTGETRHVKLTRYQGLNSPHDVVSALADHERDQRYATAAAALARLAPPAPRVSTGRRHELTVHLKLSGHHLTRQYFHHYGRLSEMRSPWRWPDRQDIGKALFDTLFGSQEQCDKVLQILFEATPARPIRYPVRVRLQTDEPELAALPWAEMTWEGNVLRDHG